jgi:hypothetical protein
VTQEALKLTLQTLELSKETMKSACKKIDELKAENKALKEALAQPQQEPFGYFKAEPFGWTDCAETDEGAIALYQAPPQRTEQNFCSRCGKRTNDIHTCTPPQDKYMTLKEKVNLAMNWFDSGQEDRAEFQTLMESILAQPPQRTWVGLSDDEVESYWDWEDFQTGAGRSTILEMVRDIEAKLKEKNGYAEEKNS